MMFGQQNYSEAYQQPIYGQQQQDQMRQSFQPMQPMQPMQMAQYPTLMQRGPQNNMVWVQGEAGAKSYLIAAGNTVPLWDSENQSIYLKTVDASGVPSMRILDYTERDRTAAHEAKKEVEYVTRKEFEEFATKMNALTVKTVRKATKEVAENV